MNALLCLPAQPLLHPVKSLYLNPGVLMLLLFQFSPPSSLRKVSKWLCRAELPPGWTRNSPFWCPVWGLKGLKWRQIWLGCARPNVWVLWLLAAHQQAAVLATGLLTLLCVRVLMQIASLSTARPLAGRSSCSQGKSEKIPWHPYSAARLRPMRSKPFWSDGWCRGRKVSQAWLTNSWWWICWGLSEMRSAFTEDECCRGGLAAGLGCIPCVEKAPAKSSTDVHPFPKAEYTQKNPAGFSFAISPYWMNIFKLI